MAWSIFLSTKGRFKDDYRFVLRTLECLFTSSLCFESCKTTQNVTFHNNLHNVIQSSLNKDVLSMVGGW